MRRLWDTPWLWMALVVVLCGVPLFHGLDRQDFDNDEAMYSFSVEAMAASGDWLTPRVIYDETSAFLEKPPLKIWLVALPIRLSLLPPDEFGMRFWDAVMSIVALLYIFATGRRLAGPVCGVAAAFLLLTHQPLVFQHGLRSNNMEAALFLCYAAGVYHFLAWRTAAPDSRGHLIGVALAFVLGFMTKFVAALFLPVILAAAILVKGEDRQRLRLYWPGFVLAALVAVALIAPWFVYQYLTRPSELWETMFGQHVMRRFTAYLDPTHLQPWHFYLTELWNQLRANGTALLTAAGATALLLNTARRRWLEGALIVLWFVVPFAAISAGTSKLYHYAYPFLPPVALAGGYAAALIARFAWRWLARPVQAMAGPRDRFAPAAIQAALTLLVVLAVMPMSAYVATLDRTDAISRPLHDVRACLSPIIESSVEPGRPGPGVWAEAPAVSHTYHYYLGHLGPWQNRDIGSDATVAANLFAPNSYRLVLLSKDRYAAVRTRLAADAFGLLELAARKAELDLRILVDGFREAEVGILRSDREVLLLPGPYARCAPERVRRLSR